ncbi:hypothetical protein QYF36_016399 [Acer negundo]|nr:hypothetical protein QYF36_016399 [Acer negundo]
MTEKGFDYVVVLMSETIPGRVVLFEDSVDSWIHIACPRLFIDWGDEFVKPEGGEWTSSFAKKPSRPRRRYSIASAGL